jgi:hypothetical protein
MFFRMPRIRTHCPSGWCELIRMTQLLHSQDSLKRKPAEDPFVGPDIVRPVKLMLSFALRYLRSINPWTWAEKMLINMCPPSADGTRRYWWSRGLFCIPLVLAWEMPERCHLDLFRVSMGFWWFPEVWETPMRLHGTAWLWAHGGAARGAPFFIGDRLKIQLKPEDAKKSRWKHGNCEEHGIWNEKTNSHAQCMFKGSSDYT